MSNMDVVCELIRKLEDTGLADQPGRLLYSGVGTLCRGHIYMLGENPGGDPDAEDDTPRQHLEVLRNKPPYWNEYVSGIWKPRGRTFPPGEAGMQKRVCGLLSCLGLSVETVCASNLIFLRSKVSADLGKQGPQAQLAEQCWPVHRYLIEYINPTAILTIGKRAFDFIVKKGLCESKIESIPAGKRKFMCRAVRLRLGASTINVISIPHLGGRIHYDIRAHPQAILWVRKKLYEQAAHAPSELGAPSNYRGVNHELNHELGTTTMALRQSTHDDYVFTYVRPADDSQYEKKLGTAGHARFLLFKVGMTVREFLDSRLHGNEPRRVDVTYNIKARPRQRTPNLELSPPEAAEAIQARAKYLRKES